MHSFFLSVAGELRNFYSGTFYASDSYNKDPIFIATAVRKQIQTFGKDISFSVLVRSGGIFYVDGYLYADKTYGSFHIHDALGEVSHVSLVAGELSNAK